MGNPVLLAAGAIIGLVCVWILAKSPVIGVYVLGLLIPFQIYLGSSASFEGLTLAFLVSQVTVIFVFLKQAAERKLSVKASPLGLPIAGFIMAKILSTTNSSDLQVSWQEIKTLIAFLAVFMAVFYSLHDMKQIGRAAAALLVSGIFACGLGFVQALSTPEGITEMMSSPVGTILNGSWIKEMTDPGGWYSGPAWVLGQRMVRVVGPFFNPDYYAAYLGVLIALCLGMALFAERTLHKVLLWPFFLILLLNLFLTHSRGGHITFVICGSIMLIVAVRMGKSLKWLIALPMIAVIPIIVVVSEAIRSESLAELVTRSLDMHNDPRWMIWGIFWSKVGAHPILGHGLNRVFPIPEYPWMSASHAHNLYLQLLFATGAAGLSAFIWLIITWLKGCRRACSIPGSAVTRGLALGLFGVCVWLALHSLVDYNFLQIKNGMLWWYVLGISAALLHRLGVASYPDRYRDAEEEGPAGHNSRPSTAPWAHGSPLTHKSAYCLAGCILVGLGLGVYTAIFPMSLDLLYGAQAAMVLILLVGSIIRSRHGKPRFDPYMDSERLLERAK